MAAASTSVERATSVLGDELSVRCVSNSVGKSRVIWSLCLNFGRSSPAVVSSVRLMLTLFVPAEAARHAQGSVRTRAPVTSLQINAQMPLAEEQPDVRTAL